MFTKEVGPFGIFLKLELYFTTGEMTKFKDFMFGIYQCIWCSTVWFTMLAVGLWFIEPWIVIGLAAMAIAVAVSQFVSNEE